MRVFLGAFAWSALISASLAVVELIPYWRSRKQHWTERARARVAARTYGLVNPWLTPAAVTLSGLALMPQASWPSLVAGSLLGSLVGDYVLARSQHSSLTFFRWAHLAFAGLVIHFARYGLLITAIAFMPRNFSWRTTLIVAGYLTIHLALQLGGFSRLLRWLGLLVSPRPRLTTLVEELTEKYGVSPRATWELVSLDANACALVTTRELAFSQPLIDTLPNDEIKAVCAHEFAHLAESRTVLFARIAGTLTLAPFLVLVPLTSRFAAGGFVICGVVAFAAYISSKKLTFKMERHADVMTVAAIQDGPTYARALESLHRINEVVAVQQDSAARTHPNLYDRMVAAGATPDFPRPAPPSSWSWSIFLLFIAITISAIRVFRS